MPLVVLSVGLLMVSNLRYPHLVNRYLRGRRSFARLLMVLAILLLLIVAHEYTIAVGTLLYAFSAPVMWAYGRVRARRATSSTVDRRALPDGPPSP